MCLRIPSFISYHHCVVTNDFYNFLKLSGRTCRWIALVIHVVIASALIIIQLYMPENRQSLKEADLVGFFVAENNNSKTLSFLTICNLHLKLYRIENI